ncbi:helix-turn-helix domain-containing protein [Streptomyces sp. L7]
MGRRGPGRDTSDEARSRRPFRFDRSPALLRGRCPLPQGRGSCRRAPESPNVCCDSASPRPASRSRQAPTSRPPAPHRGRTPGGTIGGLRSATNSQAAAVLTLSPNTVNYHLRGIYRKPGIRSRVELARLFPWRSDHARSSLDSAPSSDVTSSATRSMWSTDRAAVDLAYSQ